MRDISNIANLSLFLAKGAGRFPSPASLPIKLAAKLFGAFIQNFENSQDSDSARVWKGFATYLYAQKLIYQPVILHDHISPEDPDFFSYRLSLGQLTSQDTDGHVSLEFAARGGSFDQKLALGRVFGEFFERYFLATYKNDSLTKASEKQLKRERRSYMSLGASETTEFYWIEGRRYGDDDSPCFLPAQSVFWNYCRHQEFFEPMLQESSSNGGSGRFSKEEALLHGVYELIERDAFTKCWMNKITPSRINHDSCTNQEVKAALDHCKEKNLAPYILNLTSDSGILVYAAVILDKSGKGPACTMGISAGQDPHQTMLKSLDEALTVRLWMRRNFSEKEAPSESLGNIWKSKNLRARFWSHLESLSHLHFFLSGRLSPCPEKNVDGNLSSFVRKINENGAGELYYYEAKDPLLKKLGFFVTKAIIPGLQSLPRAPSSKNNIPHPFF